MPVGPKIGKGAALESAAEVKFIKPSTDSTRTRKAGPNAGANAWRAPSKIVFEIPLGAGPNAGAMGFDAGPRAPNCIGTTGPNTCDPRLPPATGGTALIYSMAMNTHH